MQCESSSDLRIVHGYVDSDGQLISGGGAKVIRSTSEGVYDVVFDQAFNTTPTVVATQVYTGQKGYGGGDTRDNAVVVYIEATGFRLKVGSGDGKGAWRRFTFVAIGH